MTNTATVAVQASRHRLMGGLAMAGGVLYACTGFLMLFIDETALMANPWLHLMGILWALGCICGLLGIGMLDAVGRGVFGRIALAIAVLAYALAALDALLTAVGVYAIEASPLFVVSRLGSVVGMLLVGIAALVARRWQGWRKFSPFALLLVMPLAVVTGLVTGGNVPIPLYVGLAWVLIGYAVLSTPEPQ